MRDATFVGVFIKKNKYKVPKCISFYMRFGEHHLIIISNVFILSFFGNSTFEYNFRLKAFKVSTLTRVETKCLHWIS